MLWHSEIHTPAANTAGNSWKKILITTIATVHPNSIIPKTEIRIIPTTRKNNIENIYGGDERNYGNANQGSFDREWWERTRNKVASWFGSDKETNRHHGQYGGVGPKNYKRNQQRIYEDVCDLLMENDGIDACNIEVQVEGNYVILSGTVSTHIEKRQAENLSASVPGVWDVENRIRVARHDHFQS